MAIQPKEEHQLIEWKQPVSGEDNAFILALNNPKIKNGTIEQLKQVLRFVMVKIGLRAQNFPSDEEKAVLIAHVMSEFGNHTAQEIQLAFDMAINDKLVFPERQSANCFENFSCLYFSNVMTAYRKWAKETYQTLKKDTPMLVEEKMEMSTEEKQEWIDEWKEKSQKEFKLVPIVFYDWLNLDNYKEYLGKAVVSCKKELLSTNDIPAIKDRKIFEFERQESEGFEGDNKTRVVNTAKRISIYYKLKENV